MYTYFVLTLSCKFLYYLRHAIENWWWSFIYSCNPLLFTITREIHFEKWDEERNYFESYNLELLIIVIFQAKNFGCSVRKIRQIICPSIIIRINEILISTRIASITLKDVLIWKRTISYFYRKKKHEYILTKKILRSKIRESHHFFYLFIKEQTKENLNRITYKRNVIFKAFQS